MTNRTSKPLTFQHYHHYIDVNLQTKALLRAYLGDETGVIEVQSNGNTNDHYGKVYIRFPLDTDDNGATVLGQAVEAYVNPNCNYTHKTNLPVLVRIIGSNSGYMVEQVDPIAANRVNYNTHVLNPLNPTHSQIWLRQIRDARVFATATDNTASTTVSIEPFLYYYDGMLYDGGEANSIQLSSYMPTNGTETLVVIGKRAYNNTAQVVSGASRNITPTKYSLSDINVLVDDFDDYVMPIQAVKLADGAATVLERDLHQHLRQFINVQQPRGFPNPVTRHRYIAAGYQEIFKGSLTITTGSLDLQGELVIL